MEAYICCAWMCILLLLCLPWLTATILIWVYAELYDFSLTGDVDDEDTEVARYMAIIQSVSAVVYLAYIVLAIIWLGVIGRPDETCVHCCLVMGVPIFCAVPVVVSVMILVSAVQNEVPTGQQIGIAASILCFISTLTCCFFLWWALCCGSVGKGRRSRYPVPLSYIPGLRSQTRREDEWEKEAKKRKKEKTDDYPPDYSAANGEKSGNGSVEKNGDDGGGAEERDSSSDAQPKRSWFGRGR